MAKKQFNLDNLFADAIKTETESGINAAASNETVNHIEMAKSIEIVTEPKKAKSNKSVRSIYIDDELWNDFMVYVKLNGGKTVEVTNNIIKRAVDENREKIEAFKKLMQ